MPFAELSTLLGVGLVMLSGALLPLRLAHIAADVLEHLFAPGPNVPAGRVIVAAFLLGRNLMLQGTLFVSIGNGGQGAGSAPGYHPRRSPPCSATPGSGHWRWSCPPHGGPGPR